MIRLDILESDVIYIKRMLDDRYSTLHAAYLKEHHKIVPDKFLLDSMRLELRCLQSCITNLVFSDLKFDYKDPYNDWKKANPNYKEFIYPNDGPKGRF